MSAVPIVAVALGVALMAWSWVLRDRQERRELAELLEAPGIGAPPPAEPAVVRTAVVEQAIAAAGAAISRFDTRGTLSAALERARIALRPGEYVIVSAAFALAGAAVVQAITSQAVLGLAALVFAPFGSRFFLRRRIAQRRKAFETQLPGALTLIASSLAAGHTFMRAVQMMCEESEPPLSEEFSRLVSETRLGDPVVDALARMATRLQIRDLDWVVQAIRIQQTVGGRLADLLHTLSDFIRQRDEVRKEVLVLTAEGRISAYVLGALVPFLVLMIQVINPGYMKPMFQGWGLAVLGGSGLSVAVGMVIIMRMVKIDV